METKQKGELFSILAGVAFVLVSLWQVVSIVRHFSVIGLLYLAVDIFCAVVLFAKKRDVLLLIATAALTLLKLYALARTRSFGFALANILGLLPVLALLALAVVMTTDAAVQYRDKAKQVWFVPIILSGVFFLANLIFGHGSFFPTLFNAAGYALAAIWIACPEGVSLGVATQSTMGTVIVEGQNGGNTYYSGGSQNNGGTDKPEGYIDMAVCILLLLLTCGVYWYIWIYRTTKFLNSLESGERRDPTAQLLLCMFVPFYAIYWIYKSAQCVDAAAKVRGVASDITTLCLVLAIFIPIVAPMVMQDKINNIAKSGGAAAKTTAGGSNVVVEPFAAAGAQTELGVAAELKTYKELLDSGAITQEEFDKKKKQLLGE